MPLSRRTLIYGIGATGLALSGGLWRVTRLPEAAIQPWRERPRSEDIRLAAFRFAILAPNPHNRQPWLIQLLGQDEALITCDLAKRLPETDPFDRQTVIGFGTFLETARIAASALGFALEITPFPQGEPEVNLDNRPIAHVRFVKPHKLQADPLFPAILKRHTNRLMFDVQKPVETATMREIISSPDGFTTDQAHIAPLRTIAKDAIQLEQTTPRTYMESIDLLRIGHTEIDAMPDGLALSGPIMESLALIGQLDRTQLADPNSSVFKTGLEMQRKSAGTIPALFWIKTPTNRRVDQLEAGRRYVRAQLRATQLGLAVHPLSQALQEYPEMSGSLRMIHRLLEAQGDERIQMFARTGYARPVRPAARWPLEKHLIT